MNIARSEKIGSLIISRKNICLQNQVEWKEVFTKVRGNRNQRFDHTMRVTDFAKLRRLEKSDVMDHIAFITCLAEDLGYLWLVLIIVWAVAVQEVMEGEIGETRTPRPWSCALPFLA